MLHAQQLIERAATGETLTTAERRHALEFLMATDPTAIVNTHLAELFHVNEKTIRMDRQALREQRAKFLKDEFSRDASLVIADVVMEYERQSRDIERSKVKAPLGSRRFLDHCIAIMDLRLRMIKAFQDIGYLPKNLGNMTVDKFIYKAIVSKDGSVDVQQTTEFDKDVVDAEIVQIPALPPADGTNERTREFSETDSDI